MGNAFLKLFVSVCFLFTVSKAFGVEREDTLIDQRKTIFYRPDLESSEKRPLVVLLHGYGTQGIYQNVYFGLSSRIANFNFYLAVPDGTPNRLGKRFWNAFPACCDFENTGVNDVAYITSVIESAKRKYPVDPQRVYLIGHSNGGFMAHRFACERGDLLAGFMSLAGTMSEDDSLCTPSFPVSVIQVHGTSDERILYNGGRVLEYPAYAGSQEVVKRWALSNGCNAEPQRGESYDFVQDFELPGADTTTQNWSSCRNGTSVSLWTIEGGKHIPSFHVVSRVFTNTVLHQLFRHYRR